MQEYVNLENSLHLLEFLFWPVFWTVTYVCFIALMFTAIGHVYKRATLGNEAIAHGGQAWSRPGAALMLLGVLGLATCSVLWTVIFGDLGRGVHLLVAHIHGTQDYRETILLVLSTGSMLATDIGSLMFLDHVPS